MMYVVYINNVCHRSDYGTNDPEIKAVTSNFATARTIANQLVAEFKKDSTAYIDSEWEGKFDLGLSDMCNCIIFWDKQENWSWYSEICIKKIEELD